MTEMEFKLLSLREENKLTAVELEQYYEQLREYVLARKLQTTTPGALTIAPHLKKSINKLDASVTKLLAGSKLECITDGIENIPGGAVCYLRIIIRAYWTTFAGFPAIPGTAFFSMDQIRVNCCCGYSMLRDWFW